MEYSLLPLGEKAVIIRLGHEINEQTHYIVMNLLKYLESEPLDAVIEYVPAYCSITVHYNPLIMKATSRNIESASRAMQRQLEQCIERFEKRESEVDYSEHRVIEIPVCYGGAYGPDLFDVARFNDMTTEDVVHIHCGKSYLVHMLGFAPGFPYLGGMDKRIATPRKAIPRTRIIAGSVGIAGEQTGIYPVSTPGGWRIIGRTPLRMFNPLDNVPTLVQAGDWIKFIPITEEQFLEISTSQWT
ncbi:MAG: 5-oxoprolinase subunit PxpB [Candidatus Pristimantibacillus lignocellulolyticus]|uniref:5-oxoprolinase subunit PxpB n=1 Tax=Candidatus Pristimantibacillus lignocellulolyticus TaxID=2994561 RepID=A0A9J6ZG69_9BACL|nr:MAG: 5-oxoprolinase subunit PxpB [Candidatus Pristimantibacillus lignocellulolyticus]